MNPEQIQQGDVTLEKIDKIPVGAKRLNHLTLAEGEATGHYHKVAATDQEKDVALYEKNGTLYLKVNEPEGVSITHEEHNTISVPQGTHRVGRILEYDYDKEEARVIAD